MPTVSNVDLTLTTVDQNVTIRVTYDVEFNKFERQLTGLGLSYDTHVTIHDYDGGDTPGAQILDFYPGRNVSWRSRSATDHRCCTRASRGPFLEHLCR